MVTINVKLVMNYLKHSQKSMQVAMNCRGKKLAEVTLSKLNGKWQVMDVRHRINGM